MTQARTKPAASPIKNRFSTSLPIATSSTISSVKKAASLFRLAAISNYRQRAGICQQVFRLEIEFQRDLHLPLAIQR